MTRVLADAELILSVFQENEHTKDAEILLTDIMSSEQIELYITDLCLDKINYHNHQIAKEIAKKFRDNILSYDNCLIEEQVIKTTKYTRDFECAVEAEVAIANNIRIVVTHKSQDFSTATLNSAATLDLVTVNDLIFDLEELLLELFLSLLAG